MKKIAIFSVILITIVAVLLIWNFRQYIPIIAPDCNILNISVTLDGEGLQLDGVEVVYSDCLGSTFDKQPIKDGVVKFKKGVEGQNVFSFKIPNDKAETYIDIGRINSDRFNVSEFNVNVEVVTLSNTLSKINAKASFTINGETEQIETRDVSATAYDRIFIGSEKDVIVGCLPQDDGTYQLVRSFGKGEGALVVPSEHNGIPITNIKGQAYLCREVTSIVIPDTIKEISGSAFYHCLKLKSIHIGKNVEKIYSTSFDECAVLEEITVDKDNAFFKVEGNCLIRKEDNAVVMGCSNSVIPEEVKSIEDHAFYSQSIPFEINIPDGVLSIGDFAFNCVALEKDLVLPNSVKSIGKAAFAGAKIQKAYIGDGVVSVGEQAFDNCDRLETLYIGSGVKEYGKRAVFSCENLREVTVSEENMILYSVDNCILRKEDNALVGCYNGGSIPEEAVKILGGAVECNNMTSLVVPNNIKHIYVEGIVCNNEKVNAIYISKEVESMEINAIFISKAAEGITIYCEADSKPEGWYEKWYISEAPCNVVWGYEID